MALDEKQLGRARNALLGFMERRLYIPKIYLKAEWSGHHLDVLAIDRDGSGDVHAILLFAQDWIGAADVTFQRRVEEEYDLLSRLIAVPAQYKYLACAMSNGTAGLTTGQRSKAMVDHLLAPDGLGRVGILTVALSDEEPTVALDIKPERFRAKIAALADEYIETHSADWEIRPERQERNAEALG